MEEKREIRRKEGEESSTGRYSQFVTTSRPRSIQLRPAMSRMRIEAVALEVAGARPSNLSRGYTILSRDTFITLARARYIYIWKEKDNLLGTFRRYLSREAIK